VHALRGQREAAGFRRIHESGDAAESIGHASLAMLSLSIVDIRSTLMGRIVATALTNAPLC
jgi:hypothetical protein